MKQNRRAEPERQTSGSTTSCCYVSGCHSIHLFAIIRSNSVSCLSSSSKQMSVCRVLCFSWIDPVAEFSVANDIALPLILHSYT